MVQADATTILLNKGFHALISFCDYERVSKLRWRVKFSNGVPYAVAHVPGSGKHGKTVFMHRFILNAKPEDPRIDHWDGNGLNNTRGNLRFCTNAQNIRNSRVDRKGKNTSKLKGVYRMRNGKYRAQIMHVGRKINIGNFPTEEEAARAYDALARKLHGEFARVNFPQEAA